MAELPSHPKELCFSEYIKDFQDRNFQVDEFIAKCRKKVTIECLRQDLDAYYRTLKSAMVELINKDYADFVNLSSNLVGMDKSIGDLMIPLGQLQEEITNIKLSMESAIEATESRLAERTKIRKEKETLQRLLCILESISKLERLLKIKRSLQDNPEDEEEMSEIEHLAEKLEFAPMVMERVASEFNKLQYNVRLTNHPLVEEKRPHIEVITSTLQSKLEESFQSGLEKRDRTTLTQCLKTYASINRCGAAESLFQTLIVHPYMDKLISAKTLLTHPGGLPGLFADILHFIPECSSLLVDITSGRGNGHTVVVKGFDFLVNSVWPEVVALIEKKASVIFSPGNPDTFYKNYTSSMEFVSSFEEQCCSLSSVKALRNHPSYNAFMSKWSLPVYFQIRFQDVAGSLEACLTLPLALSSEGGLCETQDSGLHPPFKLEVFATLERCMRKCWSDGIFIPVLIHRFWKLTIQLLVRVSVWLGELTTLPTSQVESKKVHGKSQHVAVADSSDSLPLTTIFKIIHDCELLHTKRGVIFTSLIEPRLPQKDGSLFQECLLEASSQIQQLIPKFASLIVGGVAQLCMEGLEAANTLPRLYRRTNKEIPSKPSSYVSSTLLPLQQMMSDFPNHYRVDWIGSVISKLTMRYFEISSELLTSVQRTEESLLKLKSYRKSVVPSATSGGMTDDNKIRLQLALDIEQFSVQVLAVHPSAVNIPSFKQLLEMGRTAKTTATPPP